MVRRPFIPAVLLALVSVATNALGAVAATGNGPPAATPDYAVADRGATFRVDVLANDSDPDGDRLRLTKAKALTDGGGFDWTDDGILTGKPGSTESFLRFTYTVSDGNGATANGELELTLADKRSGDGNHRPVARSERVPAYAGRPVTVSVLANDTDIDGDPLTVSISQPGYLVDARVNADQTITLTPRDVTASGVAYRVSDGRTSSEAWVTLEQMSVNDAGNEAPRPGDDFFYVFAGRATPVDFLANDADIDGDPLTLLGASTNIGTIAVGPGNTATYHAPAGSTGYSDVSYEVSDGRGGVSVGRAHAVVWEADDPSPEAPVARDDDVVAVSGVPRTFSPLANDRDWDGDRLVMTAIGADEGTAGGIAALELDGTVRFRAGRAGSSRFTYTVSDGSRTDTAVLRVEVRAPSGTEKPESRRPAHAPAFGTITLPVLDAMADGQGDDLRISNVVNHPFGGQAEITGDGRAITYRNDDVLPAFDSIGWETVDADGNKGSGLVDVTLELRDTPSDQPPRALTDTPVTERGRPLTYPVLHNDPDLEGGTRVTRMVRPVEHGAVTIAPDGQTITYTPDANWEGTEYLEYEMSDGRSTSRAEFWAIVVGRSGGGDLAVDDHPHVPQGQSKVVAPAANDRNAGPEVPRFSRLITTPESGRAETAPAGSVRYTPDTSFWGRDSFVYETGGGATATVVMGVTPINTPDNDAPAGRSDSATAYGETTVDVLNNDGDVDGDRLGVEIVDPPAHGTATVEGAKVRYRPAAGYAGPDRFTYRPSDGRAAGNTTAVALTVASALPVPSDPAISAGPSGGDPDPSGRVSGDAPVSAAPTGYWVADAGGHVHAFGAAAPLGDAAPFLAGTPAVDIESVPGGGGYWILDRNGRVFAFGAARYFGGVEAGTLPGGERASSLSSMPTGRGYWIFTNRGRVLAFGDAGHYGDMSGRLLNGPVGDSIATPTGRGYYMVASDGGIFTFGDAAFLGSMGATRLNAPVRSLVPDTDGRGYWLVASDGGVFAFEAGFRGSMGDRRLNAPVTGMVPYGNGYLMVAEDGGIFNFSQLAFSGSLGDRPPTQPVVAVTPLR